MADCSMACSLLRMLVNEGLLWGMGLQHSEGQETKRKGCCNDFGQNSDEA